MEFRVYKKRRNQFNVGLNIIGEPGRNRVREPNLKPLYIFYSHTIIK